MKIRKGFVSNSSSTSFCIYGTWVENTQEDLYDIAKKLKLFVCSDQHDGGLYIGRSWSDIFDDETGRQFRATTQAMVDELPLTDKEKICTTIEESWYDG